jgi:hypothetical protein
MNRIESTIETDNSPILDLHHIRLSLQENVEEVSVTLRVSVLLTIGVPWSLVAGHCNQACDVPLGGLLVLAEHETNRV